MMRVIFILGLVWVGSSRAEARIEAQDKNQPAAADSGDVSPRVVAILDRIEKAGLLESVRCRVEYMERDRVNMVDIQKNGQILFLRAQPNPLFLVVFDKTLVDGSATKIRNRMWYLFNGRTLCKTQELAKHVIEYEVVKPGEKIDFFNLDETPFLVPFGQKREQILKHFTVSLAPSKPNDPPNTDHLVCIPRPGSRMERKHKKLEFFIDRNLHLPIRIVTLSADGFQTTVAKFPDLNEKSINCGLTPQDFKEPEEWAKDHYTRDVEPLAEEDAASPPAPEPTKP